MAPTTSPRLFLTGADRTFDHRVNDLEMRRIERKHHMNIATCGAQIRRKALVILDVTGTLQRFGFELAFEL